MINGLINKMHQRPALKTLPIHSLESLLIWNPSSQLHLNEPGVFLHLALEGQTWGERHSLTSKNRSHLQCFVRNIIEIIFKNRLSENKKNTS